MSSGRKTRAGRGNQVGKDNNNYGEGWIFLISFMRWYPDMIQDLLRSEHANYDLTILQRVIMRAMARYQFVDITGCRSATKSYCIINENLDEALLWIGQKMSYNAPSMIQSAEIASATFEQISKDYPALARHFSRDADSKDRFMVSTQFGSVITNVTVRGDNNHKAVGEEFAQSDRVKFDYAAWKNIILPTIRLQYFVRGRKHPNYVEFKRHTITSAGRKQNHAYENRVNHKRLMNAGRSAFVMDVPYQTLLYLGMRPVAWAVGLKDTLTPDEWAREMESVYTGTDENPVISDAALTEARHLTMMEDHHCCKDKDNRLNPEDVIYVIGYDVSYEDGASNAKCACVVVKLTKQVEFLKRDKYLKQVVWVSDWSPTTSVEQARKLKNVWRRYCFEGSQTYIAIDGWQYGKSVVEALMSNLGDDLRPLCIYNHDSYTELELEDALPVIYSVKAGGVGAKDPDSEMIRYAEIQFENRNVELLTASYQEGIDQYKKYHRVKDDSLDYYLYEPYKKTNEMIGQIQNLKKVVSGVSMAERRISSRIQRDSWSAMKYALWFSSILEKSNLAKKKENSWAKLLKGHGDVAQQNMPKIRRRTIGRRGGKIL